MTVVPTAANKTPAKRTTVKGSAKRGPAKKSSGKTVAAKKVSSRKGPAPKRPTKKRASTSTTARAPKLGPTPAKKTASPVESAPGSGGGPAPAAIGTARPGPHVSREWPNAPVHRGLGVALLGLAGAGRFASGAAPVVGPGAEFPAEPVMDVALGAVDLALEAGEKIAAGARQYVNPLLSRAWAGAPQAMGGSAGASLRAIASLTEPLALRGRRLRADAEHEAAAAVASVLPETIELVMAQLDLTELAIENVDIERVLEATADRVDLTGFAIDHMDLVRLIEASLDEVDFTGLAISRLDFARAVTAAMEQVDVLMVAREQMDPARVAQYLRDNVDVAEALRSAPTAVAGEAVRGVRETMGRLTGRR